MTSPKSFSDSSITSEEKCKDKYSFTCKLCHQRFDHSSDIQEHQIEKHGLSIDETYTHTIARKIK